MRRQPDSNPEVFKLGHWERMAIGLALAEHANRIPGDLPGQEEEREHIEALVRVFSANDVNITVMREWVE